MNTSTGHLVTSERLAMLPPEQASTYTPVPRHLRREAARALADQAETHVNLRGRSPLAAFARRDRAAKKRKRKATKRAKQHQRRLAKRRGR